MPKKISLEKTEDIESDSSSSEEKGVIVGKKGKLVS